MAVVVRLGGIGGTGYVVGVENGDCFRAVVLELQATVIMAYMD